MDSSVVVGVGNIYATEALFRRVSLGSGRYIEQKSLGNLVAETQNTRAAIELGGTTLRDYVGAAGKPGYFIQSLNVYGREGNPVGFVWPENHPLKDPLSSAGPSNKSAGLRSMVSSQIASNGRMHEL